MQASSLSTSRDRLAQRRAAARLACKGDFPRARQALCVLSLLFNWPSTGGGTIHTKELAEFLQRDEYEVVHVYAVHEPRGVGRVTAPLSIPTVPLAFTGDEWNAETMQDRFRDTFEDHSRIEDRKKFGMRVAVR